MRKSKGEEKENLKKTVKNKRGITLIALIITVIIMLILAGVSISVLTSGEGLFKKTQLAVDEYGQAVQEEAYQINGMITEINSYLESTLTNRDENISFTPITDGSWDDVAKIHTPKLVNGMTPIYWDSNGIEKELILGTSTKNEWEQWYSYTRQTGSTETAGSGTSKWANAVTKNNSGEITGYWVWIPRYEYLITSPISGASSGTIDVNFIEIGDNATANYKIHPAFTTDINNGGWTRDIPGFWIAKYPAGFQESTVDSNGILLTNQDVNNVEYSGLKYTTPGNQYTNALGQVLNNPADTTACNEIDSYISYPVFKPLTYAYNAINIDSIYRISKEITNATSFYSLFSSNGESHLVKNSEWGAVAYLTHSNYGRNATEPNKNNVDLNNRNSKNIYAVTGIYAPTDGTNNPSTNGVFTGNVYNTADGQLGSSTGNITGVYDLTGCLWERTASYLENASGNSFSASLLSAGLNLKMVYLRASTNEGESNWGVNNIPTRYGDAIFETSTSGIESTAWNGDATHFPFNNSTIIVRGGRFSSEDANAGIFAYAGSNGAANPLHGFRVVLFDDI